ARIRHAADRRPGSGYRSRRDVLHRFTFHSRRHPVPAYAPGGRLTDAPIGVFDSGVGGLTVLRALMSELPGERFVYLGDTPRLPYGTKSTETVAHYAVQAAEALAEYDIEHLVVACNTASAVGLPCIAERFEGLQVSGVIEPGADAACAASKSGR